MRRAVPLLAVILLLTACGDDTSGTSGTTPEAVPTSTVATGSEPTQVSVPGAPVPADFVDGLIAGLAAQLSVGAAEIEIVRSLQVIWDDASLGCPEPDQAYAQVRTNGLWVVLRAAGAEYDYRATIEGEFSRCIGGVPPSDVLVDR
jgi:hypothetical protein